MDGSGQASTIQLLGAAGFGAMIGWYVYHVNRYRKGDVHFGDVVTLIGILGGSSVLAIFDARTDLFGAYGLGLFVGFFGYLLTLFAMVARSRNFDVDWFLDGRRRRADGQSYVPDEVETPPRPPMEHRPPTLNS